MIQRPTPGSAFLACALLSFTFTISAFAQSPKWKKYVSEHGKFSVLLPGIPKTDYMKGYACSDIEMVYKVYYQTAANYKDPNWPKYAKEWGVDYFDLPAIPPDADTVKKLLERGHDGHMGRKWNKKSLILNGYPALEFKLKAVDERDRADLNRDMVVRMILVKRRVYQVSVATRPNRVASIDVTKFFGSFKPVPLTDEEVAAAARAVRENPDRRMYVDSNVLESRAVKKVQPAYPPEAKATGVSGEVTIAVLVSEAGIVIRAQAVLGPQPLHESALAAARLWVFKPIECAGRPVKAESVINFKFQPR
jgi:TonB family protein